MKKVTVLGSGRVGHAIAADLANQHAVTVVDQEPSRLMALEQFGHGSKLIQTDLSATDRLAPIVRETDLVINALPGYLGYRILETLIGLGRDIVDISFLPENPLDLDEKARRAGVTAVIDAGVAPGLSNLIAGYHAVRMQVENFVCYVGGLPFKRTYPYQYKAPFSPVDVIEEYTRPARLVENGRVVTRPALSEPELIDFEPIGTLEAFNTDGLRSLLQTLKIPNMKEKTLRYPGHIDLMRVLRETGFFSTQPVEIGGSWIRPIDMTTRVIFPHWQTVPGDDEFTLMQINVEGFEAGCKVRYEYRLFDRFDSATGTSSMARTTGYTCTAIANLLLNQDFHQAGVIPPEMLGESQPCFEKILAYLRERRVAVTVNRVENSGA